ncbi:MAG: ABC transporter ATP-binding protein [Betaproteobacteria bacterium]
MTALGALRGALRRPTPPAVDDAFGCDGGVARVADPADAADGVLDIHVRSKRYGERVVLRDVHLQLAPGEIVSLVGASGCGKSTLLRIVAGLDGEHMGDVRLAGRAHAAPTREIGFIFQEPRLFPWCSVADNIAFESGAPGRADPRVAALLAEVGLAGYDDALPKQLSGGQAQRVALARGLYGRPRVLLLDEPFSAVDAFTRMKLQDVLTAVVRRHRIAVLLVTHDIDEAAWLSDRVLVMEANPGTLREEIPLPAMQPRERGSDELSVARRRVFQALEGAHAF